MITQIASSARRFSCKKISTFGFGVALALVAPLAISQVTTKFTYDAGDNLATVTDPRGLVTSYVYDGIGQRWQQQSPDTGVTTFAYDSFGRLLSFTRANGVQTSYGYDAINRRTTVAAGGLTQNFSYDSCTGGIGRLCAASDASTTTSYTYSPEGWITGRSFLVNGVGYTIAYSYNSVGQVSAIGYPGAVQVLYSYASGDVSAVQLKANGSTYNVATNISYQPADSAMSQWTSSNGVVNLLSYDTDGRSTGVQAAGVQSLGLSFDAGNRVTGLSNGLDAAMNQSFGYDSMSRLISVYSDADNEALQYDASGNRVNEVIDGGGAVVNIDPDSNRALGQSGAWNATWGFDPAGNLTTVNGNAVFAFDAFNRLQSASGATYFVNPEGQRIGKTVNGVVNYFAPSTSGAMMAEYQAANSWTYYIWLNGRLVGRFNQGNLLAVHADQVGRPEVMTDENKAVVWRARNFAFDRTVTVSNAVPLNLGFPGQYFDSESALWNNGARDYSAGVGRYIESDPLGLSAGINTYAYVGGNPLNNVDPLGLFLWPWESPVMINGGSSEEQAQVIAAVNQIFSTPRGQEMLAQIEGPWYAHGSPQTLNISDYGGDEAVPGSNELSVNPDANVWVLGVDGKFKLSLPAIISHEMGHSLMGDHDDGPCDMNNTTKNENPVEQALGLPIRMAY